MSLTCFETAKFWCMFGLTAILFFAKEISFKSVVFTVATTTWKIKSSTSSLDLCAPTKLAQISVESEQYEAEIQYDRWSTPEWCNCEKCEKISTS